MNKDCKGSMKPHKVKAGASVPPNGAMKKGRK